MNLSDVNVTGGFGCVLFASARMMYIVPRKSIWENLWKNIPITSLKWWNAVSITRGSQGGLPFFIFWKWW
ncbi:MAG: hypothetical protein COZ87_03600 [Candidatus Moranbacteria bacterium CG_4_8_14_3_um_filter_43_15]|nr:MAG: hypothetical protein COW51_04720 [Candidatus Moranbacteria bacterium CG17_big_fil_post_rev_8_21_14_2_50_44_12]PIW93042.1 MAG: hypothetical protein COZ87_03600 [Candidatus Moranbacteria bacterium CG_4_8_14_3_um_filter_43_15]